MKARLAIVVVTGVTVAVASVTLMQVRSKREQDVATLQASLTADAALRAAAQALRSGIRDGSAAWNPATHTASSARD